MVPLVRQTPSLSAGEDFACGAPSAGDRAVNGAVVAGDVGVFAGEKERFLERSGENLLAAFAANSDIAVCAEGERI